MKIAHSNIQKDKVENVRQVQQEKQQLISRIRPHKGHKLFDRLGLYMLYAALAIMFWFFDIMILAWIFVGLVILPVIIGGVILVCNSDVTKRDGAYQPTVDNTTTPPRNQDVTESRKPKYQISTYLVNEPPGDLYQIPREIQAGSHCQL